MDNRFKINISDEYWRTLSGTLHDDSRTTRMTKEMMMTVWCLECEFGIREIRKLATLINLVAVKKFC